MNIRAVGFFIGRILWVEAFCMVPALFICMADGDWKDMRAVLATIALLLLIGTLLLVFKSAIRQGTGVKEGFAVVALSWILISLFGALPFFLSGAMPDFFDAFFETVSGFTTTGASCLTDVEAMSRGLLYWRAFTNWLGGMGVLAFVLVVIPLFSKGSGDSIHMMRAEVPGPVMSKVAPRMRRSTGILYAIYAGMTVLMIALLCIGGMPLFDSICHTFATAGTGGFSTKNLSIGFYNSYYIQTVIAVFAMLFGVNFTVYFLLLVRDFKTILKSSEIWVYFGINAVATALIAANTYGMYTSVRDTVHHAFFQVSSIMTTTGFSSTDFDQWPALSKAILLVLMVIGTCAASTGGGLKISRLIILLKSARNEVLKILYPRSVYVVKLDNKPVSEQTLSGVVGYFTIYCIICVVSVLLIAIDKDDFVSAFSAVIACVNNVGPGLGMVGPMQNYHHLSGFSKIVLSANMLIGRLEIFPMLLLFSPRMWRGVR